MKPTIDNRSRVSLSDLRLEDDDKINLLYFLILLRTWLRV